MVKKVAFIGAGSMAEAVIAGLINTKFLTNETIFVTNKENEGRLKEIKELYDVHCSADKAKVIQDADVVVFATKPYDIENAIKDARQYITNDQLVISVVAGISTAYITSTLEKDIAVIRTMPNTSATIGYSATAICKGKFATDRHLEIAKGLFQAIGTVSVVEEHHMHVVTGISGSGPAYLYYLVEAMQEAAIQEGLDADIAKQLITQTVIGAGNMLEKREEAPSTLREQVTSPNGTTAAGIATLSTYRFQEAVNACVKSATNRSKELGKS